MIRAANEADMLTTPYVFSEDDAVAMTEDRRRHHRLPHGAHHQRQHRRADREVAGGVRRADRLVGAGGKDRARGRHRALPRRTHRLARGRNLRATERAQHVHGFYGASSMERLPTEVAMTAQTKAFKADQLLRALSDRTGSYSFAAHSFSRMRCGPRPPTSPRPSPPPGAERESKPVPPAFPLRPPGGGGTGGGGVRSGQGDSV